MVLRMMQYYQHPVEWCDPTLLKLSYKALEVGLCMSV